MASSFGKSCRSGHGATMLEEPDCCTVAQVSRSDGAGPRARSPRCRHSLISQANVVVGPTLGVPNFAVAERYIRLTAMALASSFGQKVDPQDARRVRGAGAARGRGDGGTRLGGQTPCRRCLERGLWWRAAWLDGPVFDVPVAAELPYEMLAANSRFRRRCSTSRARTRVSDDVLASRALMRIIALGTNRRSPCGWRISTMADRLATSLRHRERRPGRTTGWTLSGYPQPPDVPPGPKPGRVGAVHQGPQGPPGPTGDHRRASLGRSGAATRCRWPARSRWVASRSTAPCGRHQRHRRHHRPPRSAACHRSTLAHRRHHAHRQRRHHPRADVSPYDATNPERLSDRRPGDDRADYRMRLMASPPFSGNPTAPTPSPGDKASTSIATWRLWRLRLHRRRLYPPHGLHDGAGRRQG